MDRATMPPGIDHLGRQLGDREFPASPPAMAPSWSGCKATAGLTESALRAPAPTVPRWLDSFVRQGCSRRGRPPGSTDAAGPRQVGSAGRLFRCSGCAVWCCLGRAEATPRPGRGDPGASRGTIQCRQSPKSGRPRPACPSRGWTRHQQCTASAPGRDRPKTGRAVMRV
jgi:hypothetical protein